MTDKQVEEIKEIIAQALSESIIGRVEQSIMNVLSPKVARMQTLQAEAHNNTEEAKAELGRVTNLVALAEQKLKDFVEIRSKADKEFNEIVKDRAVKITDINKELEDHRQTAIQAAVYAKEQIDASRQATDKALAEHQAEIDAKTVELAGLRVRYEDFRKSVGLPPSFNDLDR